MAISIPRRKRTPPIWPQKLDSISEGAAINYYKRHIGDYMKDASHLSLLEHGVYMRLLDVYYTRESAVPVDHAARLFGARSKFVIESFWDLVFVFL